MRLLNVNTYKVKEFVGDQIPPYSILSHRWGAEEVSFKDFRAGRMQESAGYLKIMDCCRFTRKRSLKTLKEADVLTPRNAAIEWTWVDTCCIDKRSSAELSEAINSMYQWYQDSAECYVYLADVPPFAQGQDAVLDAFKKSVWFTRAWTLQELLAPKYVIFCTSSWEIIGHRCHRQQINDEFSISGLDGVAQYSFRPCYGVLRAAHLHSFGPNLEESISATTGIPTIFLGSVKVYKASVAQRLSWVAHRKTTRTEDIAYCLLGLLRVSMPLLYGEGTDAWLRLQQEIIRRSSDESIFAWIEPSGRIDQPSYGMLAPSPECFASSGTVVTRHLHFGDIADDGLESYTFTNKGIVLSARAHQWSQGRETIHIIRLACRYRTLDGELHGCNLAIKYGYNGQYRRTMAWDLGAYLEHHLLGAHLEHALNKSEEIAERMPEKANFTVQALAID